MTRRTVRGPALAIVLLVVMTACSSGGGKAAQSTESSPTASSTTDSNDAMPGKTTFGPDDDDAIIRKAVEDVQSFYEDEFPKLYGEPFQPVGGGLFPYGPDDPPPECGGPGQAEYAEVAQNAFYCPPGDF